MNMAPRWQAAWWPKRVRDGPTAGDEHAGKQRGGRRGRGVRCSRNATKNWPPRHHAACQRGAVFNTRNAAKTSAPSPPRCLPAWSGVQDQKYRQKIGRLATTLLASVERCSTPEMPRNIGPLATTLLASVERCSRPEMPRKIGPLATTLLASVERCSRPEMPLKIGRLATTLLASVERCSRPAVSAKSGVSLL